MHATAVAVRAVNARLAPGRVGYIGGGNDRVGHWLAAMGADVHDISDEELANPEFLPVATASSSEFSRCASARV